VARLRPVTAQIAIAVARAAARDGVGREIEEAAVHAAMWEPVYPVLDPPAAR
jgi:hypothetical protein